MATPTSGNPITSIVNPPATTQPAQPGAVTASSLIVPEAWGSMYWPRAGLLCVDPALVPDTSRTAPWALVDLSSYPVRPWAGSTGWCVQVVTG